MSVPPLLRELLGLAPAGEEPACANALVGRDELLAALHSGIARSLPGARVVAPFHLYRGRVDVAIFHRSATLGVMLEPSEPFTAAPRSGRATEAFDYAIALCAYPKDHLLEDKPPHVWGFRAYATFDGTIAFAPARAAGEPLGNGHARLVAREPLRKLDGNAIASALTAQFAETFPARAVVREFPCGGAIADIAVVGDGELHLYEIKAVTDSASRLARQAAAYDGVATTCTLVTTCNHRSFRHRVPEHWGWIEAATFAGRTRFMRLRAPRPNPHRELQRIAALLETGDLRRVLRDADLLPRGDRTLPQLRSVLLTGLDGEALRCAVFAALARRRGGRG